MEQRFFNPDWRRLGAAQPGGTGVIKRPVEQRMLTVAGSKHSQGTLKLWCDVLTMEEAKKNPPVNIRPPPPEPFELRVVIWDASEMFSMDGSGLNDLQFTATLAGHDPVEGQMVEDTQETDTHWRATDGKGSFAWRLVFKLNLPMKPRAKLTIKAWDRDPLEFKSDLIGRAEIDLNSTMRDGQATSLGLFDEGLRKYHQHVRFNSRVLEMSGSEQLKAELRTRGVPFDSGENDFEKLRELLLDFEGGLPATAARYPKEKTESQYSTGVREGKRALTADEEAQLQGGRSAITSEESLYHPNRRGQLMGKVRIEMELLPITLAERRPAGMGRDEPNQFPKLEEPVREEFHWTKPFALMRTLLGPKYYAQFRAGFVAALLLTLCLLILPPIVADIIAKEAESVVVPAQEVEIINPPAPPAGKEG